MPAKKKTQNSMRRTQRRPSVTRRKSRFTLPIRWPDDKDTLVLESGIEEIATDLEALLKKAAAAKHIRWLMQSAIKEKHFTFEDNHDELKYLQSRLPSLFLTLPYNEGRLLKLSTGHECEELAEYDQLALTFRTSESDVKAAEQATLRMIVEVLGECLDLTSGGLKTYSSAAWNPFWRDVKSELRNDKNRAIEDDLNAESRLDIPGLDEISVSSNSRELSQTTQSIVEWFRNTLSLIRDLNLPNDDKEQLLDTLARLPSETAEAILAACLKSPPAIDAKQPTLVGMSDATRLKGCSRTTLHRYAIAHKLGLAIGPERFIWSHQLRDLSVPSPGRPQR